MRRALILLPLILAGCGQPVRDDHFTNAQEPAERAPSPPEVAPVVAVRVGDLGPNFDACSSIGTARRIEAGAGLTLRAGPFDYAEQTGTIPPSARFFVCTRSLDQKWLGIVLHESGQPNPTCGVSEPVTQRRAYDGPCRSGWVASAGVRLVADVGAPAEANRPEPQPEAAR